MFNFEKLEVWHKAIAFADLVYQLTETFPNHERFGLTNQIRRAAASISSNIAEGTSRSSAGDYGRFIELATGSLFEVVSQATISKRRRFLSEENYKRIYVAAEEQSRMLSGLCASVVGYLRDDISGQSATSALNSQLSTLNSPSL